MSGLFSNLSGRIRPVPISNGGRRSTSTKRSCDFDRGREARLSNTRHRISAGESASYTRFVPARDSLPAPILKLIRQLVGAANGTSSTPPRMRIPTAYGVLTLDAKWLVPAGTLPADAARDPKSCLIAATIDLHEHPIAHAARVLRESGATPAQTKVGIHLALGKPKSVIADELGIQRSSVMATTKKLYQNLDVHNSAELATKIWLDRDEAGLNRLGIPESPGF